MNDEDEIKFEDLANNLYIGEGDEYEGETLEEFIEDIEDLLEEVKEFKTSKW